MRETDFYSFIRKTNILDKKVWVKIGLPFMAVFILGVLPLFVFYFFSSSQPHARAVLANSDGWEAFGPGGGGFISALAVDPKKPDRLYLGVNCGGCWRTDDSAATWKRLKPGFPYEELGDAADDMEVVAPHPNIDGLVFLGTGGQGGRIYRSKNYGNSWEAVVFTGPYAIGSFGFDPTNNNVIYAGSARVSWSDLAGRDVAKGGSVYKSTDRGRTWTKINQDGIPAQTSIFSIVVDSTGNVYVSTEKGVFKSADGGIRWNSITYNLESKRDRIRRMTIGSDDTLYVALEGKPRVAAGAVYRLRKGKRRWDSIVYNLPQIIGKKSDRFETTGYLDIKIDPFDNLYIGDTSWSNVTGGVYRLARGSTNWQELTEGTIRDFGWWRPGDRRFNGSIVVPTSDPHIIYFFSRHSRLFKSEDGGKNWYQVYTNQKVGGTWSTRGYDGVGSRRKAIAVDPGNSGRFYIAPGDGGILRTDDNGKSFKNICFDECSNPNAIVINPQSPHVFYAATGFPERGQDSGAVIKFTQFGEVSVVIGGGKKGEVKNRLPAGPKLSLALNPHNPQELYVADWKTGIWRWNSYNSNWSVEIDLPKANIVAYAPDGTLYATSRTGAIYKKPIGGIWRQVTVLSEKINDLAFGRQGVLFVGTEFGGLLRSTDHGATWEQVLNARDISGVIVNKDNPENVYAASRYSGVWRSEDGGNTWQQENDGLNSLDVVSLVNDPSNPDLIYVGLRCSGYMRKNFSSVSGPEPHNFTLTNSGSSIVSPGESTTNTITATLTGSRAQPVSFSAIGFPPGVTYSFSPTRCTPTCTSTLTMRVSNTVPPGNYPITVSGVVGDNPSSAFLTTFHLTVTGVSENKFQIGDRVKTTAHLSVRSSPGGRRLGVQRRGSLGTVIGGPETKSLRGTTYVWWKIDYDTGPDGWSVEDFLASERRLSF